MIGVTQFVEASSLIRPHAGGVRGVLDRVRELHGGGSPYALALVIHTEGSTYRKAGALAVVAADGSQAGAISGGCLEPELVRRALLAIAAGTPALVEFDTQAEEDALFGSGSGCRGLMRVLVLPSAASGTDALREALHYACDSHERLTLHLALGVPNATKNREDSAVPASPASVCIEWAVAATTTRQWQLTHSAASIESPANTTILKLPPARRVLLFGAGPEAMPLTRIARELGWYTTVVDHRSARMPEAELFADTCVTARPAAAALAMDQFDAALVMTHVASTDLEALQCISASTIGYVGLLGPPARREALLAMLSPPLRARVESRLRAPVGLVLGGEGPQAIALSIAAGLQKYFSEPGTLGPE